MLVPNSEVLSCFQSDEFALSYARMNVHYFSNGCFLDESPLLAGMDAIAHLPGILVQGRYDMVTTIRCAFELAELWPGSELVIVPDAGHSRMDKPNAVALVRASRRMFDLISEEGQCV